MRPIILALATAGLGLALAVWSVPKIAASLAKAPAVAPLAAVHRGALVAADRLRTAIDGLVSALAWDPDAEVRRELGLLELVLSDFAFDDPGRQMALLRASLANSSASLEDRPVSPHAWVRLAYAQLVTAGPSPLVGTLIENSMRTGRAVPELTFARLDLLLRTWTDISAVQRQVTGDLIRQAWRQDAVRLGRLVHRSGAAAIARMALAAVPGAGAELDRILSREEQR